MGKMEVSGGIRKTGYLLGLRLGPPGVRRSSPFEEGVLWAWMGGLAAHPLGWGWRRQVQQKCERWGWGVGGGGQDWTNNSEPTEMHC